MLLSERNSGAIPVPGVNGGPYPQKDTSEQSHSHCLPEGDYTFVILDADGDGICCGFGTGSYQLRLEDTVGWVYESDGDFGSMDEIPIRVSLGDASIVLEMVLVTDTYPLETSWILSDNIDDTTVMEAPMDSLVLPEHEYRRQIVIPDEEQPFCYTLTLFDKWGDGFCCAHGSGSYTLLLDDTPVLQGDGDFMWDRSIEFGPGCS